MDNRECIKGTDHGDSSDNLPLMLERANVNIDNAMKRIVELEERLRRMRDDEPEIVIEALTPDPSPDVRGEIAKWEWMTICDDPKSAHREDAAIAQALNDGWQIQSVQFGQSAVVNDGVIEIHRTRVVNLQRVQFVPMVPNPPKEEGKEATLSELTGEGLDTSNPYEETVIEPVGEAVIEPVVVQVLPENMRIVDSLPDDLVKLRDEVAGMTYEQAIKNPFTTAEDLEAIHNKEKAQRVEARRESNRQAWDEKVEAWAAKWANAGMPFEVRQPEWARK